MGDRLLYVYHRLPPAARSIMAGLYGFHLRSWRYGAETEGLIAEALEREEWAAARWKTVQEERLAFVLHRAATRVPFYREYWAARRQRGDRASWEHLENWPVLDKASLRATPAAFVADDCDTRRMLHQRTSGTTGTPLQLWVSRDTLRAWYALFEARVRRWHGVSRHDHWAVLGGQPVVPANAVRPPFWTWNRAMNELYLSANHVSRRNTPAFIRAMADYEVSHLVGYPSSLAVLASESERLGLRVPGLKVVITNAEPLFPRQREAIRRGFGCDVRETYGMRETVSAASECPEETQHAWPEVGWLEVLRDEEDAPATPGTRGRFIATSLLNADMPLIRYAVGDRGVRLPEDTPACRCARTLPSLGRVEGRTNDLLITRDGRWIYWLDPVFNDLPVHEAQIVQEALERVRVRFVPAPGFTGAAGHRIVERLQQRMGSTEVILEQVEQVPRTANGKFRAIVCEIAESERSPEKVAALGEVLA